MIIITSLSSRYSRWISTCLIVVVLASSCSSDPGPSESVEATPASTSAVPTPTSDAPATSTTGQVETSIAPQVDTCEIVDEVDAAEVLGFEATIDESPSAGSDCAWVTASGALLVVTLFNGNQFYLPAEPGAEPLDLGDDSWILVEENFGGVQVHVLSGEWVLALSVTPFGVVDIDNLAERVSAVAARATSRLP